MHGLGVPSRVTSGFINDETFMVAIISCKVKSPCWRPWNRLRPWFRAQQDREMHREYSSFIRCTNFLPMSGALVLSVGVPLGERCRVAGVGRVDHEVAGSGACGRGGDDDGRGGSGHVGSNRIFMACGSSPLYGCGAAEAEAAAAAAGIHWGGLLG